MKELIIINTSESAGYLNEFTVESYGVNPTIRLNVEDEDHYTSIDLNVSQVKELIKVLQAWVIQ